MMVRMRRLLIAGTAVAVLAGVGMFVVDVAEIRPDHLAGVVDDCAAPEGDPRRARCRKFVLASVRKSRKLVMGADWFDHPHRLYCPERVRAVSEEEFLRTFADWGELQVRQGLGRQMADMAIRLFLAEKFGCRERNAGEESVG